MLGEGCKPHDHNTGGSIVCHGTFTGSLSTLVGLTTEYVFLCADKVKESVQVAKLIRLPLSH